MSSRAIAIGEAATRSSDELVENRHPGMLEVERKLGRRSMNATPLKQNIDDALARYFEDLDGTEPSDLYNMVINQVEYPLLRRVLDYTGGNQSRAAEILGINRSTLRKKLRSHGLID
ncbi:DNA-binding transcriptional regulator Fis [Natronospira bacteriovora]|uniref:Putative Fis-like DNA-binding protein n=1 Tax=Natronospira bacteriovora TaxID=3069753 RepID=A0ABU0W7B1_9GAMM|nr:DNA-binding transcriptional regulator Fis [Natronospira sp. AB-CW4]MDQ2069643.1 DNA-binding transcriptional regulator Fis [Natronospira sp. AB-CW4]